MKICILTHPLHNNYGGLLQAYALQKVLRDMGHDVVTDRDGYWKNYPILNFRDKLFARIVNLLAFFGISRIIKTPSCTLNYTIDNYNIGINNKRFVRRNIRTVSLFNNRSLPSKCTIEKYDAFVVGSDQVWRSKYVEPSVYFLNFIKSDRIKKIAYAASFGVDNLDEYIPKELMDSKTGAKLFDAISVREESGISICNNMLNVNAVQVLDPTMLLDKSAYLGLISEQDIKVSDNTANCYILDKSKEKTDIINHICKKLGLEAIYSMPEPYNISKKNIKDSTYISISTWLSRFRDAQFVVTDSFHGTVFSIIFNVPFVSIVNDDRGASRFISLLNMFGLENRMIRSRKDLERIELENIDFKKVRHIQKEWKKKSLNYITNNIK